MISLTDGETELFAAALANLATESSAVLPVAEGFGDDLDCADDLDPMMLMASGLRVVAQAVYRRLTTPRGMVIAAPDYGFDLRSLLHKGMTSVEQAAIPGLVRAEVLKDERIEGVEVEVTDFTLESFGLVVRCQTAEGPFRLTLNVADAAVLLTVVGT